MSILDFFRSKEKSPRTAVHAKERLKIVLAHERSYDAAPDYLPMLQNEIMEVIAKYVHVDREDLTVNLETLGTTSRLEVNVEFPNDDVHMLVDVETRVDKERAKRAESEVLLPAEGLPEDSSRTEPERQFASN